MRLAVLASGSGTNLQALLDAASSDPDLGAEIALVVSDKPMSQALDRAFDAGVPTKVVPWNGDRTTFSTALCDVVDDAGCDAIVLAGFMRVLGPIAIERFPNRIINIHPSLLPAFPGAHSVADALAYGVKTTGVTVHFVDEEVDHGPIIAQRTVPVEVDDTEATLHARIQEVEHVVFPEVIKAFAAGRLSVDGRNVVWSGS